MLIFDLDRFMAINDSLGASVGHTLPGVRRGAGLLGCRDRRRGGALRRRLPEPGDRLPKFVRRLTPSEEGCQKCALIGVTVHSLDTVMAFLAAL
jgi:hypothetical protein